jgi:alpha-tubulin suppressor-like RCC1 family protein
MGADLRGRGRERLALVIAGLAWLAVLGCSLQDRDLRDGVDPGPAGNGGEGASTSALEPLQPSGDGPTMEPPGEQMGGSGAPGEQTPGESLPGEEIAGAGPSDTVEPPPAPPCTPTGEEICSNDLDDDCNGSIDESPLCVGYVAIDAGAQHTCALRSDGRVSCWGSNEFLALGRLGTGNFPQPEPVAGLSGVSQLDVGRDHACVIRQEDLAVLCWGDNEGFQLGDGTGVNSATPVVVPGVRAARIGAGNRQSCAMAAATIREVSCWGGAFGVTGRPTVPTVVPETGGEEIAVGALHACIIGSPGGPVSCWGENSVAQLGDGTTESSATPVPVLNVSGATRLASGGGTSTTCAIVDEGRIQCWGKNDFGEAGSAIEEPQPTPIFVDGITGALDVTMGFFHACAILADRTVACWGSDVEGQGAFGPTRTSSPEPRAVPGLADVRSIGAGNAHTCAVTGNGSAYCWGQNTSGQLGQEPNSERNFVPKRVPSP